MDGRISSDQNAVERALSVDTPTIGNVTDNGQRFNGQESEDSVENMAETGTVQYPVRLSQNLELSSFAQAYLWEHSKDAIPL